MRRVIRCRKTYLIAKGTVDEHSLPEERLFMAIFEKPAGRQYVSVPVCPASIQLFGCPTDRLPKGYES